MNINIRIDLTPGSARRIAYVGLTLLLVGLATVAYAVPVKFVSHQKLTAEELNSNFADLEARVSALSDALDAKADKAQLPVLTEWKPYTPIFSTNGDHPVPNQTTKAYYRRVGDTIEVRSVTTFSAAPSSSAGDKGYWQLTLPEGLAIDYARTGAVGDTIFGGGFSQHGNLNIPLGVYVRNPNSVSAVAGGNNFFYLNDSHPAAFDAGSSISLFFSVPVVGYGVTP